MRITVCIGSACHVKGAGKIVEELHKLIKEHNVEDKVQLGGSFCMNNCQKDVCVSVDETVFSVKPEDVKVFFEQNVLQKV